MVCTHQPRPGAGYRSYVKWMRQTAYGKNDYSRLDTASLTRPQQQRLELGDSAQPHPPRVAGGQGGARRAVQLVPLAPPQRRHPPALVAYRWIHNNAIGLLHMYNAKRRHPRPHVRHARQAEQASPALGPT